MRSTILRRDRLVSRRDRLAGRRDRHIEHPCLTGCDCLCERTDELTSVHASCRWWLCARRSVSCSLRWPSWRCNWMSSRSWCSGWRTPSIALNLTRIAGSRSSRRNTRRACSSSCSSVEVQSRSSAVAHEKQGLSMRLAPLQIYYKSHSPLDTVYIVKHLS